MTMGLRKRKSQGPFRKRNSQRPPRYRRNGLSDSFLVISILAFVSIYMQFIQPYALSNHLTQLFSYQTNPTTVLLKNDPEADPNALTRDQPNQECKLLDGRGNALTQQLMPPDGTVIFSMTVFGTARLLNVISMLTDLLTKGEQPKFPNLQHIGMITVSGNETLIPLLHALSQASPNLVESVLIAELAEDFGPISRVVSACSCFDPSKDYTFVVGDDDVVYNRRAIFFELPDILQRVHQRLKNKVTMVGYAGLEWIYPIQWGGFVKGGGYGHHVNNARWEQQRNASRTPAFCMDTLESLSTDMSSLCDDIIQVGILENYALVAFHRSAVDPQFYQKHHHPDFVAPCFWGDDFWLGYYSFRMKIPLYVVKSRVTNPAAALIRKLPQPDGSVGAKPGGKGNLGNYRNCEKTLVDNQNNCSWCI